MSKPLWFHKTKSNRIILLGPKQEDAAGGCREREGRPCAREDAAEVSRAQIPAFSLTGGCCRGLPCAEPAFLLTGGCCLGLSCAEPAFLLTGSCCRGLSRAEPAFLLTGGCCLGLSCAEPAFSLTGSCCRGLSCADPCLLAHGRLPG